MTSFVYVFNVYGGEEDPEQNISQGSQRRTAVLGVDRPPNCLTCSSVIENHLYVHQPGSV